LCVFVHSRFVENPTCDYFSDLIKPQNWFLTREK
jgi:hypothetical protein